MVKVQIPKYEGFYCPPRLDNEHFWSKSRIDVFSQRAGSRTLNESGLDEEDGMSKVCVNNCTRNPFS